MNSNKYMYINEYGHSNSDYADEDGQIRAVNNGAVLLWGGVTETLVVMVNGLEEYVEAVRARQKSLAER